MTDASYLPGSDQKCEMTGLETMARPSTRAGYTAPAHAQGGLVSVLMPAHNAARFISEALESISHQTYRNLEIIVVDDGSSDDTPAILERHAERDPRLVIMTRAKSGISAALNAGLARARGDLVARMDADDVMMPERLERQVAFLAEHPELGFCASSIDMIDHRGRPAGKYVAPINGLDDLQRFLRERRYFSFTHPTVTYRRKLVLELGGYNGNYEPCEDIHLFLRLLGAGHPGLAIRDPLLRYRIHGSSISGTNALRQVQMRNFLFHNFYAGREGRPQIEFEGFLRLGGPVHRLLVGWRDRADALQSMARYRRASGQVTSGTGLLVMAAAMKIDRLPRRMVRMLAHALAP
jgi:glycosyltransferase involved in cell wall biosynthesis